MVGMKLGALIGGAMDASDGDDGILDGTIKGALIGGLSRAAIPIMVTYATGWLVLRGIEAAKDGLFGKPVEA